MLQNLCFPGYRGFHVPETLDVAPGLPHGSKGMVMAFSQALAGAFCKAASHCYIFSKLGPLQLSNALLETEMPVWEAAGIHSTAAF